MESLTVTMPLMMANTLLVIPVTAFFAAKIITFYVDIHSNRNNALNLLKIREDKKERKYVKYSVNCMVLTTSDTPALTDRLTYRQ